MATKDDAPAAEAPRPSKTKEPTRDEMLAAAELANAERALDGHFVVHVDPRTADETGE